MGHLLATKDDIKTNKTPNQPKNESGGPYSPVGMGKNAGGQGPPVGAGAPGGDRNAIKVNLNLAVDIIHSCFNLDAPKSVQKIGLFKL